RGFSSYEGVAPEQIPIPVPALVSEDLFAAVAEQMAENQKRHRQSRPGSCFLLQGLLVCPCCGYALCGKRCDRQTVQGEPRRYIYYRCVGSNPARFGGQALCRNRPLPAGPLEQAVWTDMCALLAHPSKIEEEYQRRLRGTKAAGGKVPLEA